MKYLTMTDQRLPPTFRLICFVICTGFHFSLTVWPCFWPPYLICDLFLLWKLPYWIRVKSWEILPRFGFLIYIFIRNYFRSLWQKLSRFPFGWWFTTHQSFCPLSRIVLSLTTKYNIKPAHCYWNNKKVVERVTLCLWTVNLI